VGQQAGATAICGGDRRQRPDPQGHPIREIKRLSDEVFGRLGKRFEAMYRQIGRSSIPPERLLGGSALDGPLSACRSERACCERLLYDLLFQWFLDLELEEEAFGASTFSKNQQRLLEHQVADVVGVRRARNRLSEAHFSLDGILIDAGASLKSFRPKGTQAPRRVTAGATSRASRAATRPMNPRPIPKPSGFLRVMRSGKTPRLLRPLRSEPVGGDDRKPDGLGGRLPGRGHQTPRGPHHGPRGAGLGWAYDRQQGLQDQSEDSQAGRANLGVDEDGGRDAPEPLPEGGAHRRGLQVGASALNLLRLATLSVTPPAEVPA
jgi:transposase